MLITYASHHRWSKEITADIFDGFGKKSVAKLRSTIEKIDDNCIYTQVEPISESFFEWFLPMYESRINSKSNPHIYPIKDKTMGVDKQFYGLTLFEGDQKLGATIFSLPKNKFSIGWRTYTNNWEKARLNANPSLYTEYVACKLAQENGCKFLVHGKDKNPYGINSGIGLAAFKFSVGSQPFKCKEFELATLETDKLDHDALVFEYPGEDQKEIKKGYLITSRENEQKWTQVTKYPHLVAIETVYRD